MSTSTRHAAPGSDVGRRSLTDRALNAVLNLAAAGGALCIVLVVLAVVFDISLILFRTGSMEPAIPQGSLAVVREVPASEVGVGDVVTVERGERLPITHRVTSIEPAADARWEITMQGDANPGPDPAPYSVTTVRLVLFSIPGLARPVAALNSPWMLGGVTLAVSALVVWALWPRARSTSGAHSTEDTEDTV
ncbi:signal peptidase I [Brachybacterium sp. GCM10030252]|uniref:signal peptidase I n=1 Tax=Brachybacterium sp. GCM10030252 TaxID=3273380 RepID=UPI0036082C16